MAKITVHGGPSIAGITGASWSDTDRPDEWPAEQGDTTGNTTPVVPMAVDAEPSEVDETAGGFMPLPQAVEGDTAEYVSEPDYMTWTADQLREELGNRGLPKGGNKAELAERLAQHDADSRDQDAS
jgi:hypothetical protein